ncbi:MAG TPA: hypothetical protein VN397_02680 [Candidatus Methylomirabilis sp.]|nr:hypothetical protein [Candidatus Methylomirabilis sp.]
MNIETFKKAKIEFVCGGEGTCVPEMPRVTDVLFALRLSDEELYYSFCLANHQVYIANVHLVAAAIGFEVTSEQRDFMEVCRIIARAILDLCPEHVRCLFDSGYVQAKRLAGEEVNTQVDRHTLRENCGCRRCRQKMEEERSVRY